MTKENEMPDEILVNREGWCDWHDHLEQHGVKYVRAQPLPVDRQEALEDFAASRAADYLKEKTVETIRQALSETQEEITLLKLQLKAKRWTNGEDSPAVSELVGAYMEGFKSSAEGWNGEILMRGELEEVRKEALANYKKEKK